MLLTVHLLIQPVGGQNQNELQMSCSTVALVNILHSQPFLSFAFFSERKLNGTRRRTSETSTCKFACEHLGPTHNLPNCIPKGTQRCHPSKQMHSVLVFPLTVPLLLIYDKAGLRKYNVAAINTGKIEKRAAGAR